jgi:hypothetical membrane protein
VWAEKEGRIIGSAVVLGVATVVALYLLLHLLRPDYDPMRRFLSEYAVGRFGVLMTTSFLLQALISLALVIGLFRDVRHSGSLLAGCAFLTVAAVALAVAGVFPTDLSEPAGSQPLLTTRAGMVHQSAGTLSFLSRIVAFLSLSRAYRFDQRWQTLAPTAHRVAVAFLLLFVTFVLTVRWDWGGLAQRATVAAGLLWMCLSGLRLRRPTRHDLVSGPEFR